MMRMQKETVTLSVLLTISITILGLGIDLLKQGEYATGVACIVVGFGIMLVGVYLFEKGIIQRLHKIDKKAYGFTVG
jgi:hypothetical protein